MKGSIVALQEQRHDRPPGRRGAGLLDYFNAPRMPGSNMLGLRQTLPGPVDVRATRPTHQSAVRDLKRMLEANSP